MQNVRGIRLMVVDDSADFRSAVAALVATASEFEVVAQAGSGEQALEQYEEASPDIVVMDIRMPGLGGIEATRRMLTRDPRTHVVLVTSVAIDDVSQRAYECGAQAVVEKLDLGGSDFLGLLRSLVSG